MADIKNTETKDEHTHTDTSTPKEKVVDHK